MDSATETARGRTREMEVTGGLVGENCILMKSI